MTSSEKGTYFLTTLEEFRCTAQKANSSQNPWIVRVYELLQNCSAELSPTLCRTSCSAGASETLQFPVSLQPAWETAACHGASANKSWELAVPLILVHRIGFPFSQGYHSHCGVRKASVDSAYHSGLGQRAPPLHHLQNLSCQLPGSSHHHHAETPRDAEVLSPHFTPSPGRWQSPSRKRTNGRKGRGADRSWS